MFMKFKKPKMIEVIKVVVGVFIVIIVMDFILKFIAPRQRCI